MERWDLLYNVVDGLADDLFHPLCVLGRHPLQSDAEWCLFGAAIISAQQDISTHSLQIHLCYKCELCCLHSLCNQLNSYTPYDRREVGSYLGFDESFVEGRVWSRDHQRGQQAESESFKRVSDAAHRNHNNRSDVLQTNRLKASPAVRCLVVLREDTRYKTVNTTRQATGNKRSNN